MDSNESKNGVIIMFVAFVFTDENHRLVAFLFGPNQSDTEHHWTGRQFYCPIRACEEPDIIFDSYVELLEHFSASTTGKFG